MSIMVCGLLLPLSGGEQLPLVVAGAVMDGKAFFFIGPELDLMWLFCLEDEGLMELQSGESISLAEQFLSCV